MGEGILPAGHHSGMPVMGVQMLEGIFEVLSSSTAGGGLRWFRQNSRTAVFEMRVRKASFDGAVPVMWFLMIVTLLKRISTLPNLRGRIFGPHKLAASRVGVEEMQGCDHCAAQALQVVGLLGVKVQDIDSRMKFLGTLIFSNNRMSREIFKTGV